jgi:hypothetical protein
MKNFTYKFLLIIALTPWLSGFSQYNINAIGATQTIDFTGFDGSGFSTAPGVGQLNSNEWEVLGASDGDLEFGQTETTDDFARGSSIGGESTGGIYSFDNGTGASLGSQAAGSDMTPGSFTLAISNNTGATIDDLELEYEIWVFNDQGRSNSLNFEHGSDNITFTQEASLDFASVEVADGLPAWTSVTRSIIIPGVSLANGDTYYLKWITDDVAGGGSRDEIAIDNIAITGLNGVIYADPEQLSGFNQFVGNPSAEQSFEVSGSSLTSDITLSVSPGDYEISETSVTSGTGFVSAATIILAETAGDVAPTTIYVRLNGGTAVSPSNGTVTLTASGASNVDVVLEGQILDETTVFAEPNSLTGFSHFAGTPSAEQTFEVSGGLLTDDIVLTAPANFEISETSETSGTGFVSAATITLAPDANNEVTATDIYVRLNGTTANPTQNGDIVVSSPGATSENIALEGETFEYVLYPIGDVTANDANGVVDSLDVYVELRGIVHCIDFDGNAGYNFTIIDGEGDGVNVFNFSDVDSYVVTEGDSIGVRGQIDQFNGLTQIFAEEITVFSQGNATVTPMVVASLDETTESQLVTLESLTLVNGETTWPSNGNIEATDGTNNFTVRVAGASPLAGTPTPAGPFDMTGLGGQYDNSTPYDGGYQLFPCSVAELCNVDVSTTVSEVTITAGEMGADYQWVDCDDNYSFIAGETNQAFTATQNGNYAVIITDGVCVDTSSCVAITTVGLSTNDLYKKISLYPNPVSNQLNIKSTDVEIFSVEIFSATGQSVYSKTLNDVNTMVSTSIWESGVYFVNVRTNNGTAILKVVK